MKKSKKPLKGKRAILMLNGLEIGIIKDSGFSIEGFARKPLEYNDLMKDFVDKEEKDDKR